MPQMTRVENAEDMLIPADDAKVAQLGLIEAVRALSAQVGRVAEKQDEANEKINRVHTDVTVMKQMNDRIAKLEEKQDACEGRIRDLEINDAQISGARGGLEALRAWGPTLIGIIVAIVILVKTGALH